VKSKMKFGIAVTAGKDPLLGIERGLKAGALGFSTVYTFDHFFFLTPSPTANQLECWTVLTTIAAKTERLRVGSLVTAVGYRYPSVLAKIASTLDVISNGRLTLGIGAGWFKQEYLAYGIPFPPYSVRMEQLAEAVQVLRAMWTQKKPVFKGTHFKIEDAYCNPKPIQNPLPLLIGGNSEGPLLTLAAKEAQIFNAFWVSAEDCRRKFKILGEQERAAGRPKGSVLRSFFTNAFIVDSPSGVDNLVNSRWSAKSGTTKEEWQSVRFIGTVDQIIKQIENFEKAGAEEIIVVFGDKEPSFPEMTTFARDVIPAFE
jgi:alkanesulfonate monooxygenase SsuD/methylene tetrahydromethanopterin reductase-like flavin-dependent oxidoreductase (luciferase family)